MKPADKTTVTVLITRPIPLEILKKYASPKPLRHAAPRPKACFSGPHFRFATA